MQNYNKQQPPKNQSIPNEMLDIDNNQNLEAAEYSSNFIQRIGFWLSTITSATSITALLFLAAIEGLQQIFPDIQKTVNDSWLIWGAIGGICVFLAFNLAKLMDFHLIDIHGRAGLTEYFIFYKLWTVKKQDAALGRYRNGITFFRVVNATIHLLFLFVGYAASFFTSFLGSNQIGDFAIKNDGNDAQTKINAIKTAETNSFNGYTAQYKNALEQLKKQKQQLIDQQTKPYRKALEKGNSAAIFKADSINKAINTQFAKAEQKANEEFDKAAKDWKDSHGWSFANSLAKAKEESNSKDNGKEMLKSGLKFIGTFAITFSVLILVLQCMGEVNKKEIVPKEVDINKIVQAGTQGKNSNNNPN